MRRATAAGGHAEVVRLLLADPRVDPAAGVYSLGWYVPWRENKDVAQALSADPRLGLAPRIVCKILSLSTAGRLPIELIVVSAVVACVVAVWVAYVVNA